MFKRVVAVVQAVALLAAVATVVLLFAYRPKAPSQPAAATTEVSGSLLDQGQGLFSANCAACHGARGEGGVGPALHGPDLVRRFPNASLQIGLVSNGFGGMPAWKDRLTPEQIQAVVLYTRQRL